MVARNIEGSEMLEMNVLLRVVTTLEVEEDQFDISIVIVIIMDKIWGFQ
jgi:hypothetical protein